MGFLKKVFRIRVNLLCVLLLVLLVFGMTTAVKLHVPENLFFALMDEKWIASVGINDGIEYVELEDAYFDDFAELMNRVQLTGEKIHGVLPYTQAYPELFRVKLKWGQELTIGGCRYFLPDGTSRRGITVGGAYWYEITDFTEWIKSAASFRMKHT